MSEESQQYEANSIPLIAQQVKSWRQHRGFLQGDLEAKAGLSHNTVSRIETGGVSPRLETLERLASALGISVEELQFRKPRLIAKEEPGSYSEIEILTDKLKNLPDDRRKRWVRSFISLLDAAGEDS